MDGHSGRRSGAKLLVRLGWTREGVAYPGRWGSDAILVYIEEVTMVNEAFGLRPPNRAGKVSGAIRHLVQPLSSMRMDRERP